MKKTLQILILGVTAIAAMTLAGCTTSAGPFVTSISSDGKGNLVIEKNTVDVNGFTGTVSVGEHPTQEVIRVTPPPAQP
jgi:type IV secretion system protein VirB7